MVARYAMLLSNNVSSVVIGNQSKTSQLFKFMSCRRCTVNVMETNAMKSVNSSKAATKTTGYNPFNVKRSKSSLPLVM